MACRGDLQRMRQPGARALGGISCRGFQPRPWSSRALEAAVCSFAEAGSRSLPLRLPRSNLGLAPGVSVLSEDDADKVVSYH